MAGILSESEDFHGHTTAIIGVGTNFDQAPEGFQSFKSILGSDKISRSDFLIKFFENFENLEGLLSSESGRKEIITLVEQYWMHGNQDVTVNSPCFPGDKFKAKIMGLSDSGLLKVSSPSGIYDVYPDNHSLDIKSNSIVKKKQLLDSISS
mmetsp:Transcript_9011/g.8014  ORF Transcript_9011/g.8014 Transcript_9011/m.8014 type:complete len:151 (-) Transcript_9011:7-459(-)